jgi:hypothetical protein
MKKYIISLTIKNDNRFFLECFLDYLKSPNSLLQIENYEIINEKNLIKEDKHDS